MSIIVLDTETTGLVKQGVSDFLAQPGICEIGIVKLAEKTGWAGDDGNGYEVTATLHSFINPEIAKWEEGAMKTHGITPEKVADAPTLFEFFPKLAQFMVGADTFVGYNTKFDQDVLWYQLQRYGFERRFPWPPAEIDVMKIASKVMNLQGKKGQKYPKLTEAYREAFGKDYEGAHGALSDAQATADLLIKWRK